MYLLKKIKPERTNLSIRQKRIIKKGLQIIEKTTGVKAMHYLNSFFIIPEDLFKTYIWTAEGGASIPSEGICLLSSHIAHSSISLSTLAVHEGLHLLAEKRWAKKFPLFEEGVVCELTKRIHRTHILPSSSETLQNSFHAKAKMCAGGEISPEDILYYYEDGSFRTSVVDPAHMLLLGVCDAIKKRFPAFGKKADVFDVFKEAHFTGDTTLVESLLEWTFGKRSLEIIAEANKGRGWRALAGEVAARRLNLQTFFEYQEALGQIIKAQFTQDRM